MQLNKTHSHKKIIISAVAFLAVVALGAAFYFYNQSGMNANLEPAAPAKTNKVNLEPPTDNEIELGNQQKTDTVNPKSDNESPANNEKLDVSFTAINQNGSTVQARSLITQTISGSCNLTITNGTNSKSYTASTQTLANSTTCAGFNIPVSDLGGGSWKINLTVTSADGKVGSSTANLEVKA